MGIETNEVTRVTDSDTAARPFTHACACTRVGKHMGNASLCVTCHSGLFPRGGGSTTHGPAIIDALAPLGAKMPEGEPIGIRVDGR